MGAAEEKMRAEVKQPVFVIQKHWAASLYYDFRLEVGGVLVSWEVPKGPSTDPHLRRLAIPAKEQPLAYADFEGVVPSGEYGAGIVMVWDTGVYENITGGDHPVSISEALVNGRLAVRLHGSKLRGGYALIRSGVRWLLIKMPDATADASYDITLEQPDSVLTGRNLREIAEDEDIRQAA